MTLTPRSTSPAVGGRPLLVALAALAALAHPAPALAGPPAQPVMETPRPGQLLGAADAPQGHVSVIGGYQPGATVAVTIDGLAVPVLAVDGLFGLGVALADGPHHLEVVAEAGGSRCEPVLVDFTLDTQPPPPPVLTTPGPQDRPAPGPVAFSGRAEPWALVHLAAGGAALDVTADGDGRWSTRLDLGAGAAAISLFASDPAGNRSAVAEATVLVEPEGGGCGQGVGRAPSAALLLGLLALWPRAGRAARPAGARRA